MRERILEISKQEKLSHIGSNLGMAEVLQEIYETKKPEDIVVLDAGHAHLAHLVAEEKYNNKEIDLPLHDIHCNYEDECEVGTGSLGLGITVALGRAIANPDRDVYCVISDGGAAEGSIWEALRIKTEQGIDNLKVYCNANGFGALGDIDTDYLEDRLLSFDPSIRVFRTNSDFNGIGGVDAHYKVIV
jgi:transketolase N-terminal domain/subunit